MTLGKELVAGYQKVKWLGSGSSGQVFVALEVKTGQEWVYKEVSLKELGRKETLQIYSEVKMLEVLEHPHIIRLKESFKTFSEKLVLILEYAKDNDLETWLGKFSLPVPEELAASFLRRMDCTNLSGG